jgi:excisionase family DNA binding protein
VKSNLPDLSGAGWLTTAGAAAYTASSEKTVLRGVKSGKLQHVRLAGNLRLRFRREWLDRWMLGGAQDEISEAPANEPAKNVPDFGTRAGSVKNRVQ